LSTNNNTPNQPTLAKMATKSMAVARPGLLYGLTEPNFSGHRQDVSIFIFR